MSSCKSLQNRRLPPPGGGLPECSLAARRATWQPLVAQPATLRALYAPTASAPRDHARWPRPKGQRVRNVKGAHALLSPAGCRELMLYLPRSATCVHPSDAPHIRTGQGQRLSMRSRREGRTALGNAPGESRICFIKFGESAATCTRTLGSVRVASSRLRARS